MFDDSTQDPNVAHAAYSNHQTQKLRFKAISNLTSRRNSKENSQSPHVSKDQTIGSDFNGVPKNVLFQSAFANKKKSHFEHQNQKAQKFLMTNGANMSIRMQSPK